MKRTAIIFVIALIWGGLVRAETANTELLFQKAMYLETAKGDYRGAIPVYKEIVKNQKKNAQWAAKALYRMGLCWEKIGEKKKAGKCALHIKDKYSSTIAKNSDIYGFIQKYSKEERSKDKLRRKLETIVIPKLQVNEATFPDVFAYLHQQSVAHDKNSPANERGVNFILLRTSPSMHMPKITLNLRGVSLAEAIKYITEVTGFKYQLEKNSVVVIMPEEMKERQIL